MKTKDSTILPFDMIRIKYALTSSLAKCFYFSFCLNAITALLSSIRNHTVDDHTTIFAIIGVAIYYFVSPIMLFFYGIIRQKKYRATHRMFLSGVIVALTATFVYPIFLCLGTGVLPVQGRFIYELLQISMEENIPVKQFIAFLLGSLLMKLIHYILPNFLDSTSKNTRSN